MMRASFRFLGLLVVAGLVGACTGPISGQASIASSTSSATPGPVVPSNVITVPKSGPASAVPSAGGSVPPSSSAAPSGQSQTGQTSAGQSTSGGQPDGAIDSTGIGDPYYPDAGNGG